MDLTAHTKKTGTKTIDVAGSLKAFENKAFKKSNIAFDHLFAAQIQGKTAETDETTAYGQCLYSLEKNADVAGENDSILLNASLNSIQNQNMTAASTTPTAITEKSFASDNGKVISAQRKMEQLEGTLAAFLETVKVNSSASNKETESNHSTNTSDDDTTTSSTNLLQQASVNDNDKVISVQRKMEQLEGILTAFLETVTANSPALNTETESDSSMTSSGNDTTASSTNILQQASVNDNDKVTSIQNKMEQLEGILTAFPQESERRVTAVNQMSGNIMAVNDNNDTATSITDAGETNVGKNIETTLKSENSRTVFINRVTELLNTKGSQGASITDTISRIQTFSGTAQKKAAMDSASPDTALFVTESMSNEQASTGTKMETSQPLILNGLEKQAIGKSTTSLLASAEDGTMMNTFRQEGQQIIQTGSKIKQYSHLNIPEQKTSMVISSVFSDIMINEATTPGVRIQTIIDQITQAKQQMETDFGRVKITLNPPNLGTIDLEVIVRQNRVEVTMIADNASVQQLLQTYSEEVKSALQKQDMKIETFQVLLQNNTNDGQQQSNQWAFMQGNSQQAYAYGADTEEITDQTSVGEDKLALSASGLVSIFV